MPTQDPILVVGGAGYIGSHCVKELNRQGYRTVTFDNLVYGHRDAVKWGEFVEGDMSDLEALRRTYIYATFRPTPWSIERVVDGVALI